MRDGIARGDLRRDIDLEFTVFALYQLTVSLRDFLAARFSFSFGDAVRKGAGSPIDDAALNEALDGLVTFLRSGIGNDKK